MPAGSLAGVGLSKGEQGQRTDGVGTGLELDWGLVCEQGQSQVGGVVPTQFMMRAHTIALFGV